MVLHSGEAEWRDDSTYGDEAIIRCARIRGLARGGHIMASAASPGTCPTGRSWVDLGAA
jgi:hypothetical protein